MASILETFFILFESNADKTKKGNEDAKRSTDDLEKSLKNSDRAAVAMGENMMAALKGVAAGFIAAAGARRVFDRVAETAEYNDQLGKTAARLNINIETLDAWNEASKRASGGTSNFVGVLDYLNRGMADIATKGTSRLKPFFDELDIRVTDGPKKVRPLLDILGDLSDKLSTMDRQQAAGIGEKLGLDEGTMLLLVEGRRGVEDLVRRQRELGVTTQQDADIAQNFNDQLGDTEQMFRSLYTSIGSSILPAFTAVLKIFENVFRYLAQHKGLVIGFVAGIAGVITAMYLPAVISAAAATLAWLAPFLLIGGAIAAVGVAVGLLVDDIMNFMEGNDSVIGELMKMWPGLTDAITGAMHAAGEILDWFVSYVQNWYALVASIFGLIGAVLARVFGPTVQAIGEAFTALGQAVASAAGVVMGALQPVVDLLMTILKLVGNVIGAAAKIGLGLVKALPNAMGGWAKDIGKVTAVVAGTAGAAAPAGAAPPEKAVHGNAPTMPAKTLAAVNAGKASLATAHATPLASQSSTSIANRKQTTVNKKVEVKAPITINAAPGMSADDIGRAVGKHLEGQYTQALNHFDDGVDK